MSDLLSSVSGKSEEHEFYTLFPEGYKIGRTKYVIVFGTVMSGLGKGIFSSSLATLLQMKGFKVAPVKFDGYLNVDAGTLNPYRHGEVFVLDDGLETDMDLGNYERFLNLNLNKDNYLTGGKIFSSVLASERKGEYLGRDVQFIPHVTGFIKLFLRNLAVKQNADLVFVEVGGTVGDVENGYFIEAMRQLEYEEGSENVCHIVLTYILEPSFLGEQKSKAAQLGLTSVLAKGIYPKVIACRATNPVTSKVREKISLYSNVPFENVVSVHDSTSVYSIPLLLKDQKIDELVMKILNLKSHLLDEKKSLKRWSDYVKIAQTAKKEINIGITGKYVTIRDSYASLIEAVNHASVANNLKTKIRWIDTTEIEQGKLSVKDAMQGLQGIIVPGGFGKRGTEGKIACIKYARENNLPYLGLCFGFQMALIEFARNVLHLEDAHSTEIKEGCKSKVIDILPEQKNISTLGGNMRLGAHEIEIKKGTFAYKIYGKKLRIVERFRHRYEFNPEYIEMFEKAGIIFSGKSPVAPIMQIFELKGHPFFFGIQAHPEFKSRPLDPSPVYSSFIKACKAE